MPVTFPLLDGDNIGLSEALRKEVNVIQRIAWHSGAQAITADLERQSEQGHISSLVAHHFRMKETRCKVEPTNDWLWGAFNRCVPISIHGASTDTATSRVLLRVPMAHKLVGMVDEKMRCEVATYIWMQENCPEIPIPRLFAFGFPNGRHVSFLCLSFYPFTKPYTRLVHPRKSSTMVPKMGEISPKTNLRLARAACPVVLYRKPLDS